MRTSVPSGALRSVSLVAVAASNRTPTRPFPAEPGWRATIRALFAPPLTKAAERAMPSCAPAW
jgi:hypothetical protein